MLDLVLKRVDGIWVKELKFENGDFARFFRIPLGWNTSCVRVKCYVKGECRHECIVGSDFNALTPLRAYLIARAICPYFQDHFHN